MPIQGKGSREYFSVKVIDELSLNRKNTNLYKKMWEAVEKLKDSKWNVQEKNLKQEKWHINLRTKIGILRKTKKMGDVDTNWFIWRFIEQLKSYPFKTIGPHWFKRNCVKLCLTVFPRLKKIYARLI